MTERNIVRGRHPFWPWGKAGVRRTEQEAIEAATDIARRRGRERVMKQQFAARAHAAWSRGEVKPFLITRALDLRGLYGPEVDRACGVEEPAVDRWEAGELYPTWEQLEALARLTRLEPGFFTRGVEPMDTEPVFICQRGKSVQVTDSEPVLQFAHEALVMAGIRAPSQAAQAFSGRLF